MNDNFQTTLLFIIKDNKILLAEKKRGFGVGKVNGIGGKLESGETIEEALVRETKEEIGVEPISYDKMGEIFCDEFINGQHKYETMHVFIARDYEGKICESEEMRPTWYDLRSVPYEKMFSGDKLWIEKILNNEKIKAQLKFDENFNLISHDIIVIKKL